MSCRGLLSISKFCLFVFVCLLLVHDSLCELSLDVHYGRRLTFPTGPAFLHLDESIVLDTYTLYTDGKLDGNCSGLVFVHRTPVADTILEWWPETICPSLNSTNPYTTIWVQLPNNAHSSSDEFWLLYGDLGPVGVGGVAIDAPHNEGRLSWDLNAYELRLSANSVVPDGWENANVGWDGLYVTNCVGEVSSCEYTIAGSGTNTHTHIVDSRNIGCASGRLDASTQTWEETCLSIGPDLDGLPADHFHADPGSVGSITTGSSDISELYSYEFRILRSSNSFQQQPEEHCFLDYDSDPGFVAFFLPNHNEIPYDSNWIPHADSEDSFLRLGSSSAPSIHGSLEIHGDHEHAGGTGYPGSWVVSSVGSSSIDNYLFAPVTWILIESAPSHAHDISNVDDWIRGEAGEAGMPGHMMVNVRSRSAGSGMPSLSSNTWQKEVEGMIYLFHSALPPLGFQRLVTVGDNLALRATGSISSPSVNSFESVMSPVDHVHTEINVRVGDGDVQVFTNHVRYGFCGAGGAGHREVITSVHSHDCTAYTEGVSVPEPPKVGLLMATRHLPERSIVVGMEEDLFWQPNSTFPIAGWIGIGLGGFAVVILVVVAVNVLVVILCCVWRKKKLLAAEQLQLRAFLNGENDEKEEFAQIKVNSKLFRIAFSSITVKKKIGSGGSSAVVFAAEWSGKEVAFKIFQLHDYLQGGGRFEEFEKEVAVLASVSHPNILRFYGATVAVPRVGIVMELCSNGDVEDFLEANPEFSMNGRLVLLQGTAAALAHLHEREILHRDVKPANVLVDEHHVAKLMDFGISRSIADVTSDSKKTIRIGTMAPEIAIGSDYSFPVDVFSLGIMIFEVMTGNFSPYGKSSTNIELRVAGDANFRPDFTTNTKKKREWEIPEAVVDLAKRSWGSKPSGRPSMEEVSEVLSNEIQEGRKE